MTQPSHDAFRERFPTLFETQKPRLERYLARLSGEPQLAADLAQEAFIKLYERGESPDCPEAWLITVATNLFRNARSKESRRTRLLREAETGGDLRESSPSGLEGLSAAGDGRVRRAIETLSEREQSLLLLRTEGYSYRELALALDLEESSVGTLLARAKRAFRAAYEEAHDARR
ncbi:MAG: sigma-70 family RNA polymerase sigma factor [Candidatus Eisenbacteria bacterium]|nr:sigma-70 family RNA polymerase sigma factor [Candidatus Eisenbacteria bacterium]